METTSCEKFLKVGTKIVGISTNYPFYLHGKPFPKEPVIFLKLRRLTWNLAARLKFQILWNHSTMRRSLRAIVIGRKARDVPEETAMDYVGGYALALDMTAKEIQAAAKLPKASVPDPHNLEFWLKVDGELRQKGSTKDMIFKIPFIVSYLSTIMTLFFEGDVILTGTPEGVNFNVEKRQRTANTVREDIEQLNIKITLFCDFVL